MRCLYWLALWVWMGLYTPTAHGDEPVSLPSQAPPASAPTQPLASAPVPIVGIVAVVVYSEGGGTLHGAHLKFKNKTSGEVFYVDTDEEGMAYLGLPAQDRYDTTAFHPYFKTILLADRILFPGMLIFLQMSIAEDPDHPTKFISLCCRPCCSMAERELGARTIRLDEHAYFNGCDREGDLPQTYDTEGLLPLFSGVNLDANNNISIRGGSTRDNRYTLSFHKDFTQFDISDPFYSQSSIVFPRSAISEISPSAYGSANTSMGAGNQLQFTLQHEGHNLYHTTSVLDNEIITQFNYSTKLVRKNNSDYTLKTTDTVYSSLHVQLQNNISPRVLRPGLYQDSDQTLSLLSFTTIDKGPLHWYFLPTLDISLPQQRETASPALGLSLLSSLLYDTEALRHTVETGILYRNGVPLPASVSDTGEDRTTSFMRVPFSYHLKRRRPDDTTDEYLGPTETLSSTARVSVSEALSLFEGNVALQYPIHATKSLTVAPSLRGSAFSAQASGETEISLAEYASLNPALGVSYFRTLRKKVRIQAGFHLSQQALPGNLFLPLVLSQENAFLSCDQELAGGPLSAPCQAPRQREAAFSFDIAAVSKSFRLGISPSLRQSQNLFEDAFFASAEGDPLRIITTQPESRILYKGIEVTAELPWWFTNQISYVYSQTQGTKDEQGNLPFTTFLDQAEQTSLAFGNLPTDRPHSLKITAHRFLTDHIQLGATYRFLSGTPFDQLFPDPATGAFTSRRAPRGFAPGDDLNDPADDTPLRLPSLHQLDVRIMRRILSSDHVASLAIDVLNVLGGDAPIRVDERAGDTFGDVLARQAPRHLQFLLISELPSRR